LINNDQLSRVAYRALGTDVLHARLTDDQDDHRYFTGIEIALVVGTQLAIAFWTGFFKGVTSGVEKVGERTGEAAVSKVLDGVRQTLDGWQMWNEEDLPERAEDTMNALDEAVNRRISHLSSEQIADQLNTSVVDQEQALQTYLEEIGLDAQSAHTHASRIAERLRQEVAE
jgi:hypothetical protein